MANRPMTSRDPEQKCIYRQPDRRGVEDGRQVVGQAEVGKAPGVRHPVPVSDIDSHYVIFYSRSIDTNPLS